METQKYTLEGVNCAQDGLQALHTDVQIVTEVVQELVSKLQCD